MHETTKIANFCHLIIGGNIENQLSVAKLSKETK